MPVHAVMLIIVPLQGMFTLGSLAVVTLYIHSLVKYMCAYVYKHWYSDSQLGGGCLGGCSPCLLVTACQDFPKAGGIAAL